MAIRLPTPESVGLGRVQRSSGARGPIGARQQANTFKGEQLQRVGQAAIALAAEVQTRRDETSLLEAQEAWNTKRREWLDPNTGVFATRNGDAVGVSDRIQEETSAFSAELQGQFSGLSNDGRQALTQYLESESQRLYERAATHELGQSFAYEQALLEASIANEAERAIGAVGTPGGETELAASLLRAGAQIDSWLVNQGIDPDSPLGEQTRRGKLTEHVIGVANALALNDPEGAAAFVEANEASLNPSDVTTWKHQNRVAIATAKASTAVATAVNIDRGVASGAVPAKHQTKIDMKLGPDRPLQPNDAILNVVGTAAEDVLGPGARIEVFSGRDDGDADPNNSPRHLSGDAVDIRVYRPDGSQVEIGDPEFKRLALAFANRGALGIGFGLEYMGSGFHVDMFDSDAANARLVAAGGRPQFGPAWGSGGNAMENELTAAMSAAEGIEGTSYASGWEFILGIEDPDVRAKAIQRYEQQSNFQFRQMRQAAETVANDLVAQAVELQASGQQVDIDAMIAPYRGILGGYLPETVARLDQVARGATTPSNPELFVQLNRQATSSSSEVVDAFLDTDIRATYGGRLSDEEITSLEAMQLRKREDLQPDRGSLDSFYSDGQLREVYAPVVNSIAEADERVAMGGQLYLALDAYQRAVVASGGQLPTRREMQDQARIFMRQKVSRFDPAGHQGLFDRAARDSAFRDVLMDVDKRSLSELLETETLVLSYDRGAGEAGTYSVTGQDIAAAIARYREVYGSDPMPSQVVMLLQYQIDKQFGGAQSGR